MYSLGSKYESPIGSPFKFVAEPDQFWKVPNELYDGSERPRADLGLGGRHSSEVHKADGGGRAGSVRSGQAVDQNGTALREGRFDELEHRPEEVGQFF